MHILRKNLDQKRAEGLYRSRRVTDGPQGPELIVDGVSGLLVPPGDSTALAAALERLMADPQLQLDLARGGRRRVEGLFEMNRNGRALAEAYDAAGLLS